MNSLIIVRNDAIIRLVIPPEKETFAFTLLLCIRIRGKRNNDGNNIPLINPIALTFVSKTTAALQSVFSPSSEFVVIRCSRMWRENLPP